MAEPNGSAEKIRYGADELLGMRYLEDENEALQRFVAILRALGSVVLELDSIGTDSMLAALEAKNVWRQAVFERLESDEEDYYTDSSDDQGLRKPALYVDGEPDFESGPPQDGFEFLRRVRWEEARCEPVKVAKIPADKLTSEQTSYMPSIPPISACDPDLLPSKEWESEFISEFSKLRKGFADLPCPESSSQKKLPHFRDKDAWRVFCLGSNVNSVPEGDGGRCEVDPDFEDGARSPYLSILLNMDVVARATVLCHHIAWLQELESLPEERAVWLYALTAVVDMPLDADTSASIRELLRKCAYIRASRSFRDERELRMLNILITIAGKYFGQADS